MRSSRFCHCDSAFISRTREVNPRFKIQPKHQRSSENIGRLFRAQVEYTIESILHSQPIGHRKLIAVIKMVCPRLRLWLCGDSLSFREIENILGSPRPTSAHFHPAWWSHEDRDTRHVQCKAWLDAGFLVDADISHPVVVFNRQ
jgi:hypothetical protein